MTAALQLDQVVKHFPGPRRGTRVHAVNDVSFSVAPGETVALVGESGSGKTTLGRLALQLERVTSGRVLLEGRDITQLSQSALRALRPHMQMVFQDPWATLNPRMRIRSVLEEPLKLHTTLSAPERLARIVGMAERVHLGGSLLDRFPAQLSGGQLQRVALARALMTQPRLVVLDEPTSSLDLSVRAEILELLAELRAQSQVSYLFITHDLGTVRLIADRIVVLYLGAIVESGPTALIFNHARHPYTRALFSAQLSTDVRERRERVVLQGEIPSPVDLPRGCSFAGRCPAADDRCRAERPALVTESAVQIACFKPGVALAAR
ncbi:MAG: ATP-binding cassette domain-containing protein [Betaproteobacteria bacterium]|nr:ATP-binding cassette domain-containing protein [Betaproteobacteria bacterium]